MERIIHVGVAVKNLDEMIRFYGDVLGMKVSSRYITRGDYIETLTGTKGIVVDICKMTADSGDMIEFLQCNMPTSLDRIPSMTDTGITHIAIGIKDIDALYSKLKTQGIHFVSEPLMSPGGDMKVCWMRDPENNFLEVIQLL